MEVKRFIMTVGVQYVGDEAHPWTVHPLGLTGRGYSIIEAPTLSIATAIASAITGNQYAFLYPDDERAQLMLAEHHHAGCQLHIPWLDKGRLDQITETIVARGVR